MYFLKIGYNNSMLRTAITYTDGRKELKYDFVVIENAEKLGVSTISHPDLSDEQVKIVQDTTYDKVQSILNQLF